MNTVPSFNLYADGEGIIEPRFLHIETIPMRSLANDWIIRPHRHPELFQFLLLVKGSAEMLLEGSTSKLEAPALTAVTPNTVHGYAFQPDTEGYVLTIGAAYLRELVQLSGDPAALEAVSTSTILPLGATQDLADEMLCACERIAAETRRERSGRELLVVADLLRILGLFARLDISKDNTGETVPGSDGDLFERFRIMVEERFREQLSISDYASALATSERTLRRATKARSGRTPLEILRQRRLLEAQRDLLYSAVSVSEVAYRVGFQDQAYFTRYFAAETGVTPTQFRKRHKSYWGGAVKR